MRRFSGSLGSVPGAGTNSRAGMALSSSPSALMTLSSVDSSGLPSSLNVLPLRALVAAAQDDDQHTASLSKVDPIAGTMMYPKFADSSAYRLGVSDIALRKTADITDLRHAQIKAVWTPDPGHAWSKEIWAPELHRWGGKWYIYFAADAGENASHRIYVVENENDDPVEGTWVFKGTDGPSMRPRSNGMASTIWCGPAGRARRTGSRIFLSRT